MNFLKIIFIAFIGFVSFQAHAIRSVGNGGGLAEMRMVYFHLNLSRFLDVCLVPKDHCGLSATELSEWQMLAQTNSEISNKYEIDFKPHINNLSGFLIENKKIIISSDQLYDSSGNFKSANQLLSYLISIRLQLIDSQNSFQFNFSKLSSVVEELVITDFQYQVPSLHSFIRLTLLRFNSIKSVDSLVVVEDLQSSYVLNDLIVKKLPCGKISDWQFESWGSQKELQHIYIYAETSSVCDKESDQKKLLIDFRLKSDNLIDADSIKVQFFAN